MKRDLSKKFVISIILLSLCMALMVGCGSSAPAEEEEAAKGPDTEFLMGTWIAKTCTQDDVTVDAMDVFGEFFSLYFQDDGKCQMCRGQKYALVDWTMNEDGTVTMTGDNTYEIRFPDDSKTEMICVIQGIDVLLEKYEE